MNPYQLLYKTFKDYIKTKNLQFFSFENQESLNIFINIFKKNIQNLNIISINDLFYNFLNYTKNLDNTKEFKNQFSNLISENYNNIPLIILVNFNDFISNIEQLSIFFKNIIDNSIQNNFQNNFFFIIDKRILNLISLSKEILNIDELDINLFLNLINNIVFLGYNLRESFSNNFFLKLFKYCSNSILDVFIIYQIVDRFFKQNNKTKLSFNKTFLKEIIYYLEENFNINKNYSNLINKDNYVKIFYFVLNNIIENIEENSFLYDFNIKEKIFYKYYILNQYYHDLEKTFAKNLIDIQINTNKFLNIINTIENSVKLLKKNVLLNPILYISKSNDTNNLKELNKLEEILQIIISISKNPPKELENILLYLRETLYNQNAKNNNDKNNNDKNNIEDNIVLLLTLLSIFIGNNFLLLKIQEKDYNLLLLFNTNNINLNVTNLKETLINKLRFLPNLNIIDLKTIELQNTEQLYEIFIDFIISTIQNATNTTNAQKLKIIELILNSNLLAKDANFLNNKAFYYIMINNNNLAKEYLDLFFEVNPNSNDDNGIVIYNLAYINYVKGDYKKALKILEDFINNIKKESFFSVIKTILPIPFKNILKKIKDNNLNPNLEFFFNIEFNISVYVLFLLSIANLYYLLDDKEKALKIIEQIKSFDYEINLVRLNDIKFYKKSTAIIYKDTTILPKDNTFELFIKLIK
ncbi:MAG: hypothetical protein N2485_01130 [bacterium]|nr:hypothetical protein [bacterium]